MNDQSKIDLDEIMEYILTHDPTLDKNKLKALTIGELVLMKVLLQMDVEKK